MRAACGKMPAGGRSEGKSGMTAYLRNGRGGVRSPLPRDLVAGAIGAGGDPLRSAVKPGTFGRRLYRLAELPSVPVPAGPRIPTAIMFPDRSCDNVPIAHDPEAARRMLAALALSVRPGLPSEVEETGFWGADRFRGGYDFGPPFTDHQHDGVDVASRRGSYLASWLQGHQLPSYYFHTHPNGTDPAPISGKDKSIAAELDSTGIAIDRGGRVTCWRK